MQCYKFKKRTQASQCYSDRSFYLGRKITPGQVVRGCFSFTSNFKIQMKDFPKRYFLLQLLLLLGWEMY